MADYFVRVQLTGSPPESDYETLHSRMANNGYSRQLASSAGLYTLPHATYHGANKGDSSAAVAAEVKGIADGVRFGSRVLAIKWSDWAFNG